MLFRSLGGSFTAADEGDEDTPATDASNDIEVIQPNDTTDTLEANQVDLDKLYLASYRITLAEVAPDYALTGLHVGVNIGDKTLGSLSTITAPGADGNPLPGESADNDAFRPNPSGDRVIQVVEEFFDNSWNGEGTFEEYEQNTDKNYGDDKRDEANENKNNASFWRTDGYVIVAARSADGNRYNDAGTARDAASYQYEQIYNGVRYDVPRPMFAQSGGQAGLVKIPRTSLTGRVWDDTGAYNADGTYDLSCGYNGVQDEGERGLAGQIVYLTQWYWKPAVETGNTVTGEGEWVQNTAFGEDTYTSNKYSRADGEAVAPIIYDGNAAAERTPLEAVYADASGNTLKADGTPYTAADADATRVPGALRVATDADGQWLVENLPTVYVSDEDKYYLASYRVELADLYREPSNGEIGRAHV